MGAESKIKKLGEVLRELQQELGKAAVSLLGESGPSEAPAPLRTGLEPLDAALSGGLPRQRILELHGPPSSGKTALGLALLAATQRAGGVAAYVDVEHGLEPERARALGLDPASLVVAQPETGEQSLFIAEELVRSGAVDLVVVDSIAALVPEAELDGRVGEAPNGLQARLIGQALRRLTVALRRSSATVVLVNHLRPGMDGGPGTTPGGSALPFFTAVRLALDGVRPVLAEGEVVAARVKGRVVKNKLGPAGAELVLDLPLAPAEDGPAAEAGA